MCHSPSTPQIITGAWTVSSVLSDTDSFLFLKSDGNQSDINDGYLTKLMKTKLMKAWSTTRMNAPATNYLNMA